MDQLISNRRSMAPDVPPSNGRVASGTLCLFLHVVNVDVLQVTGCLSRAGPVLPVLQPSQLPPEHSMVEASGLKTVHVPA